ncbi:cystinosin [Paracoccidioides lutzii Pb01]|uniref:Cystinosin n=1 Tax=Paracoccidioides lutzii (strain ATCC MYA-826 / Pb01) TaxID=502779 RepID=C1H4B5_PARBA|nr:cystinosin [Paracoccidioides lutzii Pb01]EEH34559.2 cystinosin [Paracoccidioides lutzii Pb01]
MSFIPHISQQPSPILSPSNHYPYSQKTPPLTSSLSNPHSTICWSASFYPQPILNYRRRSTHGLAIDFPATNALGFISYLIYTATFLYSPLIRRQYASRYPIAPEPTVRLNDLAFAAHAVILSLLVFSQFFPAIWGFRVSKFQKISTPIVGVFWGCTLAVSILVVVVAARGTGSSLEAKDWAWIDVCYALSYIKLIITIIKYIPQAWVNYKRKSTVGWSISAILLDFSGGVLSISQLLIDSAQGGDWSGVTGNPIKLLLGNHYVIYRAKKVREIAGIRVAVGNGSAHANANGDEDDDGVFTPLLGDRGGSAQRGGDGRPLPRIALP